MNYLKIAVDLVNSLFEIALFASFFGLYLKKRSISATSLGVLNVCFALVLTALTTVADNNIAILMPTSLLTMFLYTWMYESKIGKRILYTLFLYMIGIVAETVAGMFITNAMHVSVEDTQENVLLYFACAMLSKLLLFTIYKILGIFKHNKNVEFSAKNLALLSTVPLSSFVSVFFFVLLSYQQKINDFAIIAFCATSLVVLANVAVFYFIEKQGVLQQEVAKLNVLEQQYNLQKNYYSDLKDAIMATNKQAHDYKNFLLGLTAYIEQQNFEEATKKIFEYNGKMKSANMFETGNSTISALLYYKRKTLYEVCDEIEMDVKLPEKLNVDEIDVCMLIGNAIDNAIEALSKIEDRAKRRFYIQMNYYNDKLSCTISNSTDLKSSKNGLGEFETHKKNKYFHGFGINNMREIVEKYDGSIVIDKAENEFKVVILV